MSGWCLFLGVVYLWAVFVSGCVCAMFMSWLLGSGHVLRGFSPGTSGGVCLRMVFSSMSGIKWISDIILFPSSLLFSAESFWRDGMNHNWCSTTCLPSLPLTSHCLPFPYPSLPTPLTVLPSSLFLPTPPHCPSLPFPSSLPTLSPFSIPVSSATRWYLLVFNQVGKPLNIMWHFKNLNVKSATITFKKMFSVL